MLFDIPYTSSQPSGKIHTIFNDFVNFIEDQHSTSYWRDLGGMPTSLSQYIHGHTFFLNLNQSSPSPLGPNPRPTSAWPPNCKQPDGINQ